MFKRSEYSVEDIRKSLLDIQRYIGLPLDIQKTQLSQYVNAVGHANIRTNLTGAKTARDFIFQHVLDSLLALEAYIKAYGDILNNVWDVGSGAGLPGAVMAAVLPNLNVHCVERRTTKAAALSELLNAALLTRVKVHACSFEDLSQFTSKDLVWFRAFLPGEKMAEYFANSLDVQSVGKIVLMKSRAWDEESKSMMAVFANRGNPWAERFQKHTVLKYNLPIDPIGISERYLIVF